MADIWSPDYEQEYNKRIDRLRLIRSSPGMLAGLKEHYKNNPADFINDWGSTFDPRNPERGLPAIVPFLLFPKQRECLDWLRNRWLGQEDGLIEKSRDMGLSWLCVAFAVWMILFHPGTVVGFGSRKETYVDDLNDPKSLFWKARQFISLLPVEFRPNGFDPKKDAPFMTIKNRENGSAIVGEAGDNIGRGNRTSIYFKDESAFYDRPSSIDAALSQTSNCKIDVSTPNGNANPFAFKRFGGRIKVFTFHWRDDPRKNEEWYQKQIETLDPVTVAQEIDINYSASVEGVLIPSAWVQAAIDSHKKLNIVPSGIRRGGLDVADEGIDKNAYAARHGILLEHIEQWSGSGSDIFQTVQKAFSISDNLGLDTFLYDADGLGAGVRGDSRVINDQRKSIKQKEIAVDPYRGSNSVHDPEKEMVPKRKNKDFFANLKAQSWWSLRMRFQATYRALQGMDYNPDDIISISSTILELPKLTMELSQPTYSINTAGKIIIDKSPAGTKSPNLADSVAIVFTPMTKRTSFFG